MSKLDSSCKSMMCGSLREGWQLVTAVKPPIHGLARVRLQEPVSSELMDRLHARPREFRNIVPAQKILAQVRREPKREGNQQGHAQETANKTAAPIKAQYIQPPCRHE